MQPKQPRRIFTRGKTLRILVGYRGRLRFLRPLMAHYIGKYMPGNPNIIISENMPGAGVWLRPTISNRIITPL
jgi:hypothetical protein